MPLEWIVGRICEEFHCLPSAAWREWLSLPAGFMETIIDFRAYGRAKAAYDARGRKTYEPPLTDVVMETDFALVLEQQQGRR